MHWLGGAAQGDAALQRVTTSVTALHWLCHMPMHCLVGISHQINATCNTPRALPHPEFTNWASGQRSSLLSQPGLPRRSDAKCHRLHCTSLAGDCGPGWSHCRMCAVLPGVVFPAAVCQSAAPWPQHSYHNLQCQTKGFICRSSIIEVAASEVVLGPGCRQGLWLC